MQDVSGDIASHTEGDLRLHAAIRTVVSPGIWFVLAVQTGFMLSLQWSAPAETLAAIPGLRIFLAASVLLLFFYLQAGAFHALTLKRDALSVREIFVAGRGVFGNFVWLTLKTGLLIALVVNFLVLTVLLLTGLDFKALMQIVTPFLGSLAGLLAFVFVYWLPYVFVRREFRLLPSLKAALLMAWGRIAHSAFLALLVLLPALAMEFLPLKAGAMQWAAFFASGIMGWIAYIYCVDVLRQKTPISL